MLSVFGNNSTNWGKVRINKSQKRSIIRFSIEVIHNDGRGCIGDLRGYAKLASGNTYVYSEKVDRKLNYGEDVNYLLTFRFIGNILTIEETAKGNSDAVNLYHGAACTFDGTFIKGN